MKTSRAGWSRRGILKQGVVLALLGVAPRLAHAWSSHYLVMAGALNSPEMAILVDQQVAVEPIESFLKDAGLHLQTYFGEHYRELGAQGSKRFREQKYDPTVGTRLGFLRAARLNPSTRLTEGLRLLPHEKEEGRRPLPPSAFGYRDKPMKGVPLRFVETRSGSRVAGRQVLITYVDEPDWGLDQELWSMSEYGYGTVPYGAETGTSSQAAFHMLFAHENLLVRLFAAEVTEGMMAERVALFSGLSRLAFGLGHPYWGFRFLAWSAHYLQDLGQPYHAKAVPDADLSYYVRFALSGKVGQQKMKHDSTQLVKNRHFLYEDYVAYGLEQSAGAENPDFALLRQSLAQGKSFSADSVRSADAAIRVLSKRSASHAAITDAAIQAAFGGKVTQDSTYDLESDPTYEIGDLFRQVSRSGRQEILRATSEDFLAVGAMTRAWITQVLSVASTK